MRKDKQVELVFYFVGAVFIAWLSVLVAPCIHEGLFDAIIYLNEAMNSPFSFELCQDTLKCILISESIYSFSYLAYYYNRKNYRRNEEYGSAKWANNKAVNKKYTEKDYSSNKILSQNVRIGLDGRRHRRNLNTLVIGGSGAGKTRFFGKPNLMQCNTSFVVLDPKGEQLRDVGNLLEKEGYVIKVVDLINMNRSHCYNPFRYIKDDKDVLKLITNLIRNTTPKGSQTNDPFWEKSETALLEALCLYLLHEAPEEEQNFTMVMEMIAAAEVKEDDEEEVREAKPAVQVKWRCAVDGATITGCNDFAAEVIPQYFGRAPTEKDRERIIDKCRTLSDEEYNGVAISHWSEEKADLLRYALNAAYAANKIDWRYIDGIWDNFTRRGIRTAAEAQEYEWTRKLE